MNEIHEAAKKIGLDEANQREHNIKVALQRRLMERGIDRYLARQMVEAFQELARDINSGRVNLDEL